MTYLLKSSLSSGKPIDIIYMKQDGTFSKRTIIVKNIQPNYIIAFCLNGKKPRTFKIESILSAAKVKPHRGDRLYA